jgi:glycosyltransferase involved in cell wall biosynthesis
MHINIIFSDVSGGVKTASEGLSDIFTSAKVPHNLYNTKELNSGILTRFFKTFLKFKSKSDEVFIFQHFEPIFFGYLLRLAGLKKIINVVHTDLVGYYQSVGCVKRFVVRFILFLIKENPTVFVSKEAMLRAQAFFKLRDAVYIYNINSLVFDSCPHINSTDKISPVNQKISLGIVSRLHPGKNIDLAIRVVKQLNFSGCEANLIIFGDGPEQEKLASYLNQLGCTDIVTFAGRCNDKKIIFQSFDALLSFSSLEGFSLIIAEAISFMKPVFHTDCSSGPREIMSPKSDPLKKTDSFEDTGSGFLVKPILKSELRAYALDLSHSEELYVDYLKIFIDKLNGNRFMFTTLGPEFDYKYILRQWFDLIFKVNDNAKY